MTRRQALALYGGLFAAGLAVFGAASFLIRSPGYMDAEYYLATAGQIAAGRGFLEPFLWNFLSDPASLPAPSHLYWMPLASLVAAAWMTALGPTFRAAQVGSVLLAACLPVLAARLALAVGGERRTAWVAGALALLPGFFTPYFLTTDTFALFAVIGGLALWQIGEAADRPAAARWFGIGLLIGLGHLARADGLLLWAPALYVVVTGKGRLRNSAVALLGYLLLMVPWWVRNVQLTGGVFAPGTSRSLWLLSYDELFSYPASLLSAARWWAAGPAALLEHRLAAGWSNLQTVLAVNGYILLLPLAAAGGWKGRRHPTVRAALVYALVLFLFMSLVFPFAGARGGFFHSSAALMPLLWALAAIGIDIAANNIAPLRSWETSGARALLTTVALCLAASLSLWALFGKAGLFGHASSFDRNLQVYRLAAEHIRNPNDTTVTAVNDPPGFFLATEMASVAIPDGPEESLRQVVERYGVDWVILEADHPAGLEELYRNPTGRSWLRSPQTFLDPAGQAVFVFEVNLEAGAGGG